uniref:archaellin/type IV pilin N-terminal domain-containing protein n=1 Tax=Halorussus litoreus TaxID=1710536 RepID=UPI001E626524|nr:archaellin/type IV pilin N-terminal domain-containing protein [Halorussus litoreus]
MRDVALSSHERAQVGIGTLIVFIAMVLVAAIAAGVLINTAGVLENRAEQTGQEATGQVSDRLVVVSAHGHVTDEVVNSGIKTREDVMPNESVDTVELTVALSPGAGSVNLSRATVSWIGPKNSVTLVHGEEVAHAPGVVDESDAGTFAIGGGGSSGGGTRGGGGTDASEAHRVFSTYALDGGDHAVLDSRDQRITLYFNAGLIEAGTRDAVTKPYAEPLREGSEVLLEITTASGATTTYRLVVPPSLSGKSAVSL